MVGGAEGEEASAAAAKGEEEEAGVVAAAAVVVVGEDGARTNRAEDIRTRRGREVTIARWPRWLGSSDVRAILRRRIMSSLATRWRLEIDSHALTR